MKLDSLEGSPLDCLQGSMRDPWQQWTRRVAFLRPWMDFVQRESIQRLSLVTLVAAVIVVVPPIVRAAEPVSYEIDAELVSSPQGAKTLRVRGRVEMRIRTAAGETELRLWTLADRLAVAPSYLDERNARWIYANEIDLGGIMASELRVDGVETAFRWEREAPGTTRGRDYAGAVIVVPLARKEGERMLSLRFELDLPARFGRMGRVGERLTLTAPWYPLLLDGDVFRHDVRHRLRFRTPEGYELRAIGKPIEGNAPVDYVGPFVPVVGAPRWFERRFHVLGKEVHVLSPVEIYRPAGRNARGEHRLNDLGRVDLVGLLRQSLTECLRTARELELPIAADPIEIVVVPSRTELAATTRGWVMLSERIYQVFPLPEFRGFHHRAVRRAVFRHLIEDAVAAVEAPADRSWSEEIRSMALLELDEIRRSGRVLRPEDVIGWAGFHPMIDKLLYAPQVSFLDAYFSVIDERDPYRDAPERARYPYARGPRLLEHARDRLSVERFAKMEFALARRLDTPARSILRSEGAPVVEAQLDDWLIEPALELNYRLGTITSERMQGRYRHRIEIHRDGSARREPVEVRVTDVHGDVVTAIWDEAGSRGEIVLETRGARAAVQLDPRGRLVQSSALAEEHPRGDDSDPNWLRPPIFNGIDLSYGATEGIIIALADFEIRRRYRLDGAIRVRLESDTRAYGGMLGYLAGFGRKRDDNNLIGYFTANLAFDRLRPGFGATGEGGLRLSALLAGGYNTRVFYRDPRRGSSLGVQLQLSGIRSDEGMYSASLSTTARGNLTLPTGLKGAFVLVGGVDWVFGDALPAELPGLGGRYFLRGYETDEVIGRGRVFGVVEQRVTALSDLAWNFLHIAWVREVQLIFFAGAGFVYQAEDGRRWVPGAEVGTGIRFQFEYGGVQPGLLAVDLGVPLIRSAEARQRPPIGLHLSFDQFF